MSSDIVYRFEDNVSTVQLNRPDSLNAVTLEMWHDLAAAVSRAEDDGEIGRASCRERV